jgi:hypothetical protein
VQAGVVGGLHALQIQEHAGVPAAAQLFDRPSQQIGALDGQVAAGADRADAGVDNLGTVVLGSRSITSAPRSGRGWCGVPLSST